MSDLLKLAERCEAAAGADREIDGWIWAHMKRGDPYVVGSEPGRFPQKAIYGERLDVMRTLTADPVGAAQYIGAPAYTASLDAAKSLWPEGWFIRVTQVRFGLWYVEGWRGDKSVQTPADVEAFSLSEECARTGAALRARSTPRDYRDIGG